VLELGVTYLIELGIISSSSLFHVGPARAMLAGRSNHSEKVEPVRTAPPRNLDPPCADILTASFEHAIGL
jgi:hypothetical protein